MCVCMNIHVCVCVCVFKFPPRIADCALSGVVFPSALSVSSLPQQLFSGVDHPALSTEPDHSAVR